MQDTFKDLLTARGMTREQVATGSGVALSTIERWCAGEHKPQRSKVRQVAEYLQLTSDQLFEALLEQPRARQENNALQSLRQAATVCRSLKANPPVMTRERRQLRNRLRALQAEVTSTLNAVAKELDAELLPPETDSRPNTRRLKVLRPKSAGPESRMRKAENTIL